MKRAPFFLLAASLLVSLPAGAAPGGGKRSLQLVEATVPELQKALRSGLVTSEQLVQMYLARIEAYDDAGPMLLETVPLPLDEQYKAVGTVLPGAPVGRYRMTILSQTNEVLADGTFTIVE